MEATQRPELGKSAPYGHACANCSRAKCRCIPRCGETSCERCQRLGKDCTPSVVVRKRGARKSNSAARRARLEEKLEDLVSLLQSQSNSIRVPTSSSASPTPTIQQNEGARDVWSGADRQAAPCVALGAGNGPDNPFLNQKFVLTPPTGASASTSPASAPIPPSPPGIPVLPLPKAEEVLRTFRTNYLQFFPMVYIPEDKTAVQLREERPFLWLNIQSVCTTSITEQLEWGNKIMEILGKQILVNSERNIDLLLGLLTYLGWGMNYARGKPFINVLTNLAISIASDLRLAKPLHEDIRGLSCFKPHYWPKPQWQINKTRTNEDRRALLGTFLLTSTILSCMRFEPIRWAPNLDEVVAKLAEDQECPGDEVLVAATKIMKIAEECARLSWRSDDPSTLGPPMVHIKALRASLGQVMNSLSTEMLDNRILLSYLHTTEVLINEVALFSTPSNPVYKTFDYKRLEYLNTCLHATKASLENFLSIPIRDFYKGMSFTMMVQYSHSAQVLYRLTVLEDPGWDREAVKHTADICDYLDRTAVRMETASKDPTLGPSAHANLFARGAEALRYTIPIWSAAIGQVGTEPEAATEAAGAAMGIPSGDPTIAGTEDGGFPEPMAADFFDDTWLTDLFTSWEQQN